MKQHRDKSRSKWFPNPFGLWPSKTTKGNKRVIRWDTNIIWIQKWVLLFFLISKWFKTKINIFGDLGKVVVIYLFHVLPHATFPIFPFHTVRDGETERHKHWDACEYVRDNRFWLTGHVKFKLQPLELTFNPISIKQYPVCLPQPQLGKH